MRSLRRPLSYITCFGLVAALSGGGAPSTAYAQKPAGDFRLPAAIPIFPLPDVVLFPNVSLPLRIFEPRYRAMIEDALQNDHIIGLVFLRPGYESNYEGRPPIYPIGCAGVITSSERLPDGRFNIVLRGLAKFRVTAEDNSRVYRIAEITTLPEPIAAQEEAVLREHRKRIESLLQPLLGGSTVRTRFPSTMSDGEFVNTLAQYIDVETEKRQELLERPGLVSRAEALIELLVRK